MARPALAVLGKARRGTVLPQRRLSAVRLRRLGMEARHGLARHGLAQHGMASQGKVLLADWFQSRFESATAIAAMLGMASLG
jgi:hypothetical protein